MRFLLDAFGRSALEVVLRRDEYLSQNLRFVQTFLTNARRDGVVNTEAIAPALERFGELLEGAEYRVSLRSDAPEGAERSGELRVQYESVKFSESNYRANIRFPSYADSGHEVTLSQPNELRDDVAAFLKETGL